VARLGQDEISCRVFMVASKAANMARRLLKKKIMFISPSFASLCFVFEGVHP
jgi:hypothetical protein